MRAEKIAQALVARGHHVTVLTAPAVEGERGMRLRTADLDVRAIRYPRSPRFLWIRLRTRLGRAGNGEHDLGPAVRGTPPEKRQGRGPRHLGRSLLFLPDDEQGFGLAAAVHGLALGRHAFDVLYSTAPPFSSHLAAWVLHRLTGVPWIAEFRDPWTNNPVNLKPRTEWTDRMERRMEALVVRSADRVVVGTRRLLEEMAERYGPASASRLLLVRNGIDQIAEGATSPRRRPCLLHLGTLYGSRSAQALLEGLGRVVARETEPSALRVRFVGVGSERHQEDLRQVARGLGVAGETSFEPWQAREEALRTLADADFPILLALGQPAQVPNKLYEYLGTRKPIIALVDDEGESARLLRRAGGHILLTEDTPEAWATALGAALERARGPEVAVGSPEVLRLWSTERQFDRLVDAVEGKRVDSE